ncbi:MAG: polynucleotide adenylyltransferase PcnB [Methylococcales bacterium]|jgi:poly(A) polymerase
MLPGSSKVAKTGAVVDSDNSPRKYSRSEHNISRSQMSENALKVLYRLKKSGYEAYLVGGCVRDLLLGLEPKDFDVVTDASPEQVRKVFRNCRLIGRRFRLAHVHFGREIIEVATFRGADNGEQGDHRVHEDGRLLRDNIFGTIEDDVWRRDFTVNALYYNIRDFSVLDYTGGMQDHTAGVLRLIGEPTVRYKEDPVRMLRAVRFSVKLGFKLEASCEKALFESAHTLQGIPAARLYDEALKLFLSGKALQTFEMLRHYGLFAILFPQTEQCLAQEKNDFPRMFVAKALENSDKRIAEGKSVTPYFFLSAFLWESVQILAKEKIAQGEDDIIAYQNAANMVLSQQVKSLTIPKRVTQSMREVWLLQLRFHRRVGVKPFKLLSLPRFRAAYDFLLLRAQTGDVDIELAEWWTRFQAVGEVEQKKMTRPPRKYKKNRKKRDVTKQDSAVNSQNE